MGLSWLIIIPRETFSLPSCQSRVCFHTRCNCSSHNAYERARSLSLPPQPSSLFSEFPFVKWDSWTQYFLKFQIYNTITIWLHEIPSSFQYSTLCKWHFFALEISTLISTLIETSIVPVQSFHLKRPYRYTGKCPAQTTFWLHLRKGQLLFQNEQCHLKHDPFFRLVYFSTFWMTFLFYFYF